MLKQISNIAPLPALRNIKRLFILSDFWQRFFFFYSPYFYKFLLLCLNLPIQFLARAFLRALLDQLALNRRLQDGFLHIVRKTLIEVLELAPRLFIAFDVRQQFLNFSHNTFLLGKGRER
ncbi:hypothetical protein SDC9_86318 [bioreactor metagenome]|uniref:Uncharacterized protein n=1 Tax=bioreactor metagenome TaxID=1076179 RepID=A0A644ZPY2_9ZZZZ